ncbi:hypothetical protein KGF57_000947 [Candida theae]|uniref:non-specific serine/threonine protein kinase n=1 Tax=Candida theae TaxID=1198502 RepID=A0AAD5BHU3_9ASCO|nr:uncharacterized protein KGF57_000947 [Candida theae]KAI5964455.1 hypothetical protein KGF57_000947 [Candida theae]
MRLNSSDDVEVYEEIGRGGFGVVYRGIIKSNSQEVAIKQIDLEQDTTDLIEINKEIQILSECNSPQITAYYGSFVKNYKLWVVMEYVDGGSIFELLTPGTITDEPTIAYIVREVLLALKYLHNQGKIHRDLKSQNILVNKRGQIKLTDFGVSTQLSSNFSKRNTTVGTPYWMAPEVILNSESGHGFKADIWSLGCCAYEMLTGKPPLQNHIAPMRALRLISQCRTNGDFTKLVELDSLDASREFKDFLSCCFIENTKARYDVSKLLKHGFVCGKIDDGAKSVKRLITRKQLWNQQNASFKPKSYYIETEMQRNQVKWNDNVDKYGEKQIPEVHFDISSLSCSDNDSETLRESPQRDVYAETKSHFDKIHTKVVSKIDSKCGLSDDQLKTFVNLKTDMTTLITESNDKIILFQYLKYLYKELSKEKNNSIGKLVLPHIPARRGDELASSGVPTTATSATSAQSTSTTTLAGTATRTASRSRLHFNKFDEIEQSLLESWLNKTRV